MKKSIVLLLFVSSSVPAQEINITFRVLPPSQTPAAAAVFLAGNTPALGNWNPGAIALEKASDEFWTKSFKIPKGFRLEYKITRGNWNAQAIYQRGVIPGNTVLEVSSDTTVTIRPLMWSDQGFKSGGKITGDVKFHRNLAGAGLNYARDVIVWLPPSYRRAKTKRYPVLYMHDGQNVFDPSTSFLGIDWQADEVADSLIRRKRMQEVIIVGIYNSPDRGAEYSDTELGKAYVAFIVDSLKPMIDKTYRTLPDPGNTAVMGSSMGGLVSFLIVWQHPDVFSKAGCLSSVFEREQTHALEMVEAYGGPKKSIRLYLDCGGTGGDETLKPGMNEMVQALRAKGFREKRDFTSHVAPQAAHNEAAWAKRLWRPLTFLFPSKK